jgi:beta-phosphoglucomutase
MKAIIFDLDGVLFLSSKAHEKAYRTVTRLIGIRRFRYSDISGMSTDEAFQKLLRMHRIRYSRSEFRTWVEMKRTLAYQELRKRPPLVPHCRRLLQQLSKRFRLALVSSSSRRNMNLFLKASRTRSFFSVILSGQDVSRGKPAPDLFRLAIRCLKVKPQEAIVIEDAVMGVEAARRAKIRAIGFSIHKNDLPALKRAGAVRVIRSLQKLLTYARHS